MAAAILWSAFAGGALAGAIVVLLALALHGSRAEVLHTRAVMRRLRALRSGEGR
jgi:hypothetical protein